MDLDHATLIAANLTGATLIGTHFSLRLEFPALLTGADLSGAVLAGADLTDAILDHATLTGAILTGARWPGDTPVPGGWKLNDSGRLESEW